MIMETLNKAQADMLFHREAVFLGSSDAIPEDRAKELFSDRAVKSVVDARNAGKYWNANGTFSVTYLTYTGFLAAVSYHNAEQLLAKENTAPVLEHQSGKETAHNG